MPARKVAMPEALAHAKPLVEDGANLEYTRGICELLADMYPDTGGAYITERAQGVAEMLGLRVTLYPEA